MSWIKNVTISDSISPKIISSIENTALSSFSIILFVTTQSETKFNASR